MSHQEIISILETAEAGTDFYLFTNGDLFLISFGVFLFGVSVGITLLQILLDEQKKQRRREQMRRKKEGR